MRHSSGAFCAIYHRLDLGQLRGFALLIYDFICTVYRWKKGENEKNDDRRGLAAATRMKFSQRLTAFLAIYFLFF